MKEKGKRLPRLYNAIFLAAFYVADYCKKWDTAYCIKANMWAHGMNLLDGCG